MCVVEARSASSEDLRPSADAKSTSYFSESDNNNDDNDDDDNDDSLVVIRRHAGRTSSSRDGTPDSRDYTTLQSFSRVSNTLKT